MVIKEQNGQISITEQAVEILQTRSYIQIHVSLAAHVIRKLLKAVKEQDGKQKKNNETVHMDHLYHVLGFSCKNTFVV